MVISDFLQFGVQGNAIAFVEQTPYRTREYSYREIQDGISRAAGSLRRLNLVRGDRLILQGENSARWTMTFYASVLSGIVVVPIDASFSQEFVGKIRAATSAKFVASDANLAEWNSLFSGGDPFLPSIESGPEDLLEIIYTSGTTAEPKGVMITHGNILSNLEPIHREIQKYKKYAIPFSPLGFVHLIPLSHLFGQIMGLFIPQMLRGKVIFTEPAASNIVRSVKSNRASVVICVPQQLTLLRKHIQKMQPIPERTVSRKGVPGVLIRWWHYRKIHRVFGWKFWAFISGGASLPLPEEKFWKMLGYVVIQGYGLTETAPSVTITHPLKLKEGAVGQKLPGIEVKVAEDGEILVRGPNVTPGYYQDAASTEQAFSDGWLRTGDLGHFDETGNLILLGRKKEVIVTSEGLNVYPQDVESVLNADPRVRDSAVVAREQEGRTLVHAVLILKEGVSQDEVAGIVSDANKKLENYQHIRSWSLWYERELPRTSTGKLKRIAIAHGDTRVQSASPQTAESILARLRSDSDRSDDTLHLEQDLGLSSLERVELMVELEEATGVPIDEAAFARAKTLGEIAHIIDANPVSKNASSSYPKWKWPLNPLVRLFRFLSTYTIVFPLLRIRFRVTSEGVKNLPAPYRPVLFVSNHQSIIDPVVILRALPFAYRHRMAPAMGPRMKLEMILAAIFFQSYPLPQSSVGLREAIKHTGELVDQGYSPLVFPEGARTKNGQMTPFQQGVGVIARNIGIPVVPVEIRGAYELWPIHARGPQKGTVHIRFGAPFDFAGKEPAAITKELQAWYSVNHRDTESRK